MLTPRRHDVRRGVCEFCAVTPPRSRREPKEVYLQWNTVVVAKARGMRWGNDIGCAGLRPASVCVL